MSIYGRAWAVPARAYMNGNAYNGMRLLKGADFMGELDRLFDGWLHPQGFEPACEVEEREYHYLLTLETPGVKKDDVKIETVDDQLIVSGERREGPDASKGGRSYSERRFG